MLSNTLFGWPPEFSSLDWVSWSSFCFLSTGQEIGWEECLRNDVICVMGHKILLSVNISVGVSWKRIVGDNCAECFVGCMPLLSLNWQSWSTEVGGKSSFLDWLLMEMPCRICWLFQCQKPVHSDHMSGKPGNVREFASSQELTKSWGIVIGKILSWKTACCWLHFGITSVFSRLLQAFCHHVLRIFCLWNHCEHFCKVVLLCLGSGHIKYTLRGLCRLIIDC